MKHSIYFTIILAILFISKFSGIKAQVASIVPGGDWRDTQGNLIAATEGGIIQVDGVFYLWGMDRSKNNYNFVGVNVYSSTDLKNWKFENQILKSTSHADLGGGAVVERAKILYNSKNKQFVMWMHYEGHNAYSVAEVAYATSPTITGNFTFKSHFRPLDIDSRDLNVYMDDNGKGYLICTTKGNQNVSLFELNDSFTGISKELFRGAASDGMSCEGHAIIKTGGYYFWLMSSCTGWDFNDNHYYYATTLAGPWKSGGDIATKGSHTYESQVGFAIPVVGSQSTTFIYMGDRWSVSNYGMSRIVMLPITVSGTKLTLGWYDQWNIDIAKGTWTAGPQNFTNTGPYKIISKNSGKALQVDASGSSSSIQQATFKNSTNQQWKIENLGSSFFRITNVSSNKVIDISDASREVGAKAIQYTWNSGSNQKWQIIDLGNDHYRLVNVNTLGKALQIAGSSKTDGASAELGNFNYADNQEWSIEPSNTVTSVASETAIQSVYIYTEPDYSKMKIVAGDLNIKKIVVVDLQGKELLKIEGSWTDEFAFPLSTIPSGTYLLRLENENVSITRKFVW